MCNIHFIMPIGMTLEKEHAHELVKMLERSGKTNKDGYGIFTANAKLKHPRQYTNTKYMEDKITEQILGNRFVIGHNRLITSGEKTKDNTHPIETENLIYVHNGHISNYKQINDELSFDSKAIGYVIEQELESDSDVVKAITNGLAKLSGYLSAFIYHKPSSKLYYIVDGANFEFQLLKNLDNEKVIIGNTLTENLTEYGTVKQEELNFKIKDYIQYAKFDLYQNVIYEITEKGIIQVGKFELKPEVKTVYGTDWANHWKTPRSKNSIIGYDSYSDDDIKMDFANMSLKEVAKELESELTYTLGKGIQIKQAKHSENRFHIYGNRNQNELFKDLLLDTRNLSISDLIILKNEVIQYVEESKFFRGYNDIYNINNPIDSKYELE